METEQAVCLNNRKETPSPKGNLWRFVTLIFLFGFWLACPLISLKGQTNYTGLISGNRIAAMARIYDSTGIAEILDNNETTIVNEIEEGVRLDSTIYEQKLGYAWEIQKHYYYYDFENRLDSTILIYYDGAGKPRDIVEKVFYDDWGNRIKYQRKEIYPYNTWNGPNYIIETIYYEYEDNKLSRIKNIQEETGSQSYLESEKLFYYNSAGRVEMEVISNMSGLDTVYYFYKTNDKYWRVVNYFGYVSIGCRQKVRTDSTLVNIYKSYSYVGLFREEMLDTLSAWEYVRKDSIQYDSHGRRKTLIHFVRELGRRPSYSTKIKYCYSDDGQPDTTYYYRYSSGIWVNHVHDVIYYNAQGNIFLMEKKYFNAESDAWENCERKQYYYSDAITEIELINPVNPAFEIYPNPTSGHLRIITESPIHGTYRIIDLHGRIISTGRIIDSQIDVTILNEGLYFLTILTDGEMYVKKFLKY